MEIIPSPPLAFSHIGQRAVNQDSLYPSGKEATEQSSLFIVCDGMGGADKGEVASQLLCQAVATYAEVMDYPVFDAVHLKTALRLAYDEYAIYLKQHPFVNRMGSTLALLQFHEQGATVAHIWRQPGVSDSSWKGCVSNAGPRQINEMVEHGIITAEQAKTHPWRNRLSRAVVMSNAATSSEPSKQPAPDVVCLTDVQENDYFFMCTDGVLEQLDGNRLTTILATDMPDSAKVATLQALCQGRTKDNYSGYLIGINRVLATEKKVVTNPFRSYAGTAD